MLKIIIIELFLVVTVVVLLPLCKKIRRKVVRNLGWCALTVMLAGWVWYGIGFAHVMRDSFGLVIRSLMSSIEMFVSHSDLLAIEVSPDGHSFLEQNAWFLPVFFVIHFAAILVSAIFLINLLGNRLYTKLSMLYYFLLSTPKRLYIFYGTHEKSLLMAQNFKKELDPTQKGKYQLVFIENDHHHVNIPQRFSFLRVIIGSSDIRSRIDDAEQFDAWHVLGYLHPLRNTFSDGLLAKCMRKSVSTKIFLFSNEEENMHLLTLIDRSEQQCRSAANPLDVYCLAQRDAKNLVWESSRNANVRIVDAATLAVYQLMEKPASLPANFVQPDTERALATVPFRAVILGFGPVGQAMLHFLYEHSAFLDKEGRRNATEITVLDAQMEQTAALFHEKYPALKGSPAVRLLQYDLKSADFMHQMQEVFRCASYFVVSLDDENANLAMAADLSDWLMRNHTDDTQYRIFLPVYSHLGNRQAEALSAHTDGIVVPFGDDTSVYTHANIVRDRILERSKKFFSAYQQYVGETETWEERRVRLKGSAARNNQRLLMELQDLANAYHISSKMILSGIKSTEDTRFRHLLEIVKERQAALRKSMQESPDGKPDMQTGYPKATEADRTVLENLATCEHIRWMASAELLGYTDYPENEWDNINKKDFLKKKLSCLKDWKTMGRFPVLEATKAYDRSVVDVSFLLLEEMHKKE